MTFFKSTKSLTVKIRFILKTKEGFYTIVDKWNDAFFICSRIFGFKNLHISFCLNKSNCNLLIELTSVIVALRLTTYCDVIKLTFKLPFISISLKFSSKLHKKT